MTDGCLQQNLISDFTAEMVVTLTLNKTFQPQNRKWVGKIHPLKSSPHPEELQRKLA